MTIGIDCRLFGTEHGGIGRYIHELISHLLTIDKENSYVFFVYDENQYKTITSFIHNGNHAKVISAPYRWYTLSEQLFLPRCIKKAHVDLMHFPHFTVPLGYHAPFVVTIHDLIIHRFPDERATTLPKWLYALKLCGYKKVINHAIMNARAIITPSSATKKDILKFYNVDEKKIKVTYEGITNLKTKKTTTHYQLLTTNYSLPTTHYLLYVGSFYPHKNIENLINAFTILREKYIPDINLVLAGKKDYFYQQLRTFIDNNGAMKQLNHGIHFIGYTDDDTLANLYQNASLFVFPSLCEGFGLPPLEAMQFGTPVAASSISSIPEICGDAALYFDPNSVEDMALKIYTTLTDASIQNALRENGFKRVQMFSCGKMAEQTLQIYETVLKIHHLI